MAFITKILIYPNLSRSKRGISSERKRETNLGMVSSLMTSDFSWDVGYPYEISPSFMSQVNALITRQLAMLLWCSIFSTGAVPLFSAAVLLLTDWYFLTKLFHSKIPDQKEHFYTAVVKSPIESSGPANILVIKVKYMCKPLSGQGLNVNPTWCCSYDNQLLSLYYFLQQFFIWIIFILAWWSFWLVDLL